MRPHLRGEAMPQTDDTMKTEQDVLLPTLPLLLTATEVAEVLRCHPSTVYDLTNSGRLKSVCLTGDRPKNKRGRKGLRIFSESLKAFLKAGFERPAEEPRPAPPEEPELALAPPPVTRPTRVGR